MKNNVFGKILGVSLIAVLLIIPAITVGATDVEDVAFSPEGQFIISGAKDWTIRLWRWKTSKKENESR